MDLERLKISDPGTGAGKRSAAVPLITGILIGLVLGFGTARLAMQGKGSQVSSINTAVVRALGSESGKAFTSGGWIEAAAPQYPVALSSKIAQRLETISVVQGDIVSPGQVVARLNDSDQALKLDAANAALSAKQERARIAKANYERAVKSAPHAVSAEDIDKELAESKAAQSEAEQAMAEVDIAKKELSYCSITVPQGDVQLRVLDVVKKPGDWISLSGDSTIIKLYDPSNIQVRVDVPQANIRQVRVGGTVLIKTESNPEREYDGKVIRVDPLAELAKNTLTVRIKVLNPDGLLFPEMVAHVNFIPAQAEQAGKAELVVPKEAVMKDGAEFAVYLVDDGIARRKTFQPGREAGNLITVKSGLTSGQKVIIGDLKNISDGQKVEVQ